MVFNEVYIGRTPEIQQMCDTMGEARELYMKHKVGAARKKLYEMETMVENYFGFKTFSLDLINEPGINACTYPAVSSVDINAAEALYTTSKDGYKFKKEAEVGAISRITTGLFGNPNFTNEEVFAVFLHEVGHSFVTRSPLMDSEFEAYQTQLVAMIIMQVISDIAAAITLGTGIYKATTIPVKVLYSILLGTRAANSAAVLKYTNNVAKNFNAEFSKKLKKYPALGNIQFYGSKLINFASRQFDNIFDFVGTITGIKLLDAKLGSLNAANINPDNRPNAQARSWERLSDDFCTVYGFGNEVATALIKMENGDYVNPTAYGWFKSHCPIVKQLTDKRYELMLEYIYQVDCHPHTADRIMSIIENMEHDIKTDKTLKGKEKKMLAESLEKTKKLAKDSAKVQGELAKNPDGRKVALLSLGFKNGSSEGKSERLYTDMDKMDDHFKELQEESSIDLDVLGLDLL